MSTEPIEQHYVSSILYVAAERIEIRSIRCFPSRRCTKFSAKKGDNSPNAGRYFGPRPSLLRIFETASTYLAMVERFVSSLRSGNLEWHIVKLFVSRAQRSKPLVTYRTIFRRYYFCRLVSTDILAYSDILGNSLTLSQ